MKDEEYKLLYEKGVTFGCNQFGLRRGHDFVDLDMIARAYVAGVRYGKSKRIKS